jgi:predicted regulator of Ras-like GTPase activity (Roadblock/LC7/MglB family)
MPVESERMDPRQSRSARLNRSLQDLMKQTPDIRGALIVSHDGFLVEAAIEDAETIGPIAANLYDLADKAVQRVSQGALQRIVVDASEGTIAVVPAGPHAALVTVVNKQAKLGLILELMVRWARLVAELME